MLHVGVVRSGPRRAGSVVDLYYFLKIKSYFYKISINRIEMHLKITRLQLILYADVTGREPVSRLHVNHVSGTLVMTDLRW